jgi:hypothetical protein
MTVTDAEAGEALAAETMAQKRVVRASAFPLVPTDPWDADLTQALKRRVHRNLFMRGLPSGLATAMSEGAVSSVRIGMDPEIKRLEAPFRKTTVG